MSLHSRRSVLTSIAALTTGLAGCAVDRDERTPTATERSDQFTGSSTTPATATLRRPAGGSVVRSANRTPDPDRGDYLTTVWAITSREAVDALAVPDETENVAAARSLFSGTDFDTEAVVCQQHISEACLTRRVERVRWGPDAVAIDYRGVKSDDCDIDGTDAEATLVRVQTPLSDGLGYFSASVTDD